MNNVQLFLTRRNLLTLLEKLDYVANGGASACTIVKCDTKHSVYPITGASSVSVTSVEDNDYYNDRDPGFILDMEAGELK